MWKTSFVKKFIFSFIKDFIAYMGNVRIAKIYVI